MLFIASIQNVLASSYSTVFQIETELKEYFIPLAGASLWNRCKYDLPTRNIFHSTEGNACAIIMKDLLVAGATNIQRG